MKKVIKSAAIGIILLAVIQFSGNAIVTFAAKQLLAPYYIVGIIMLIGSFFGIYFGKKGGRILYGIVAFCMSTIGGLIISFVSQEAFSFLSDKFNIAKTFIIEIDWFKILYIFLAAIGTIILAAGIVFLVRFLLDRRSCYYPLPQSETQGINHPLQATTFKDEDKKDTESLEKKLEEPQQDYDPPSIPISHNDRIKEESQRLYTLRELWYVAGQQPFKAISTYTEIAWVKIYKDPTRYRDVYGWLKMENARDADNRQIFYADEKCWSLIDIIVTSKMKNAG